MIKTLPCSISGFIKMNRTLLAFCLSVAIFSSVTKNITCNGQANSATCHESDRAALLDFKNGLNDPENALLSWHGRNCCRWSGIVCDRITGDVIAVDLGSMRYGIWNLSGELRPSLTNLSSLIHLDLSSNNFGDILIPEFIGSLKNLQYLNLSNAGFSGIIPKNLGNLSNLQVLDVSSVGFSSLIISDFQWLAGLVSLKHLDMDRVDLSLVDASWLEILNTLPHLTELHLSECLLSGSISSLRLVNFTSLALVDLSFNSFNSMFPNWMENVSTLEYVDLSTCVLRGRIPIELAELPKLWFLNLGLNGNLTAGAFSLFNGTWKSIEVLNLDSNKIHGKLPSTIGNMNSLTDFSLFDNEIQGGIPSSIGSLCKLVSFILSGNKMTGSLPRVLEGSKKCGTDIPLPSLTILRLSNNELHGTLPDWLGLIQNLEELSLSYNLFEGQIPVSLGLLRHLNDLSLAGNRLNGTLPESIGKLSNLTLFDVSSNSIIGILSEAHFADLSKLKILQLSDNSFVLNVSSEWVPPFQIRNLGMGSCRLGSLFPRWLKSQKEVMFLDFANASISDSIPNWFWDLSFNLSLMNVSFNQITGELPRSFVVSPFADVDLSSNLFEGNIPLPSVEVELFDLSNNRFNGPIPRNISNIMPNLIFLSLSDNQLTGDIPVDIGNMSSLQVIDLSRNNLTGTVPNSIGKCLYLKALDLGSNFLKGEIPYSLGKLGMLQSLHLNDNWITGKLPSSLKNLSTLETLDLRNNKLRDIFPLWLSEGFTLLRILNLGSNAFFGEIQFDFSKLGSVQVLDLAENNFVGAVPSSLGDLRAMAQEEMRNEYLLYGNYRGQFYEENLVVNLKNQAQQFTKTLSLVTALDLSSNGFSGEIPIALTTLRGLMVLNLSKNHISGHIPNDISRLRQLGSLDLSSNDLSGAIPSSLGSLSFLAYLNLSDNNLSGRIPNGGQMSTFGVSSFEGNNGLCGAPLVICGEDSSQRNNPENRNGVEYESDGFIDRWFYLSIGVGFVAGIAVPYFVLMVRKPWRDWYFDFVDKVVKKLSV